MGLDMTMFPGLSQEVAESKRVRREQLRKLIKDRALESLYDELLPGEKVMKAIDKAFDGDADVVELVGLAGDDDEVASHREMAALMADLEEAYKAGKMGGGSYRQLSAARIAHAAVASKLSKLEEDSHAVVVWSAAPKREGVAKKLAKYNEKSGDRIGVAWAV